MKTIERSIEIDAPAEATWAVVSDLAAYREWNPSMTKAAGQLEVGTMLAVTLVGGGRAFDMKPKVLALEPGLRLDWVGLLVLPGIFDGAHELLVESLPGGRSRLHAARAIQGNARSIRAKDAPRHRGRLRADEHRTESAGQGAPGDGAGEFARGLTLGRGRPV